MSTERFLTEEQLAGWKRDGFLKLDRRLFAEEDVSGLVSWISDIEHWPETPGKWMKYFEKSQNDGSRLLQRVENFFPFHDKLNSLFNSPKFLQIVSELFGEPAVLYKEKINFKLPGGDGFKAHQDAQAGWDMYGHTIHLTAMVAVDDCTPENGCLELVSGKHKDGLIGPMWAEIPKEVVDQLTWVSCPCKSGDVVFFDSFVPHRSGPNTTDKARRVLYLTYNKLVEGDFREKYYADKRKSFPPDCERDPSKNYEYKI
eukprot:TRINITY_DN10899_c0_g1_i1.p1 TRINITY_DN10899_c0_g1~~TRINITY_DN10899_c0_g1_i1.p1  ORF type:complete len:257 (-),score=62.77 TRINITY_DN10899_c0_g1_i1:124-894(-)